MGHARNVDFPAWPEPLSMVMSCQFETVLLQTKKPRTGSSVERGKELVSYLPKVADVNWSQEL